MKIIGITYFLTLVILSTFAFAADDLTNTDCRAERIAPINLSSSIEKDSLKLTASGSPCVEGIIIVTITQKEGKEIYRETLKIKNLYVDPVGVPAEAIEKFLERTIQDGPTTTGAWPPYVEKQNSVDVEGEYSYAVSKKEYNRLCKKNAPAFRLSIYNEVFTNIVYDAKKGRAVDIWDWGL